MFTVPRRMDNFRPIRSPGSDRFLGLSHPQPDLGGGVELDEDEVLWSTDNAPPPVEIPRPNPRPLKPSPLGRFHRPSERNFGILAALPEEDQQTSAAAFLQRSPAIPSDARIIPAAMVKMKEYSLSLPSGKIQRQSAPISVPMASRRAGDVNMEGAEIDGRDDDDNDDDDDEVMLPPHEMVARALRKGSPMTTFSMMEGAGRTLKGRDLRRVRNAVFYKTGFLD